MDYLAHSGRPPKSERPAIPPQTYAEHVANVTDRARDNAANMTRFLADAMARLPLVADVEAAALVHDLGKLAEENQEVLSVPCHPNTCAKLPLGHALPGTSHLVGKGRMSAAMLAALHHAGLPDVTGEWNREWVNAARSFDPRELSVFRERHASVRLSLEASTQPCSATWCKYSLDWRLALSCLVDADHGDTARHYGAQEREAAPLLRPGERLAAMQGYVASLGQNKRSKRNRLRTDIFNACKESPSNLAILACDSPVGTGKTTAIMAHLLRVAQANNLRRIFVVLPFTNIITQAVETYRKALVLDGENPEEVVAAHHHRAEYASPDTRSLACLWRAPIVVVTAVQFFETLAAASTSALRKLHELPGSGVFVDEAHAAMPVDLWPAAWPWLRLLHERWSCHWVLASGSLARFWEMEEFRKVEKSYGLAPAEKVADLLPAKLRTIAARGETRRIRFESISEQLTLDALGERVMNTPGEWPRIVVMNTVRGAALLAQRLAKRMEPGKEKGFTKVKHLSTALCPRDRKELVKEIESRLKPKKFEERLYSSDHKWVLVATSCVEAGMNFSFRTGFRERFGLCNLVQLAGRVCREGEKGGVVYDFRLLADEVFPHPQASGPAEVLDTLFCQGKVGPEFCQEALHLEIQIGQGNRGIKIANLDISFSFASTSKQFRIITDETTTVLVDNALADRLERGENVDKRELMECSVQIWTRRIDRGLLPIAPLNTFKEIMMWGDIYDDFLGIYAGVLKDILLV